MVRVHSAYALGTIGPEAKAALPALVKLLKDEIEFVRVHAAFAVAALNPESQEAKKMLMLAFNDSPIPIRKLVVEFLEKLEHHAAAAALKKIQRE